MLVEALLVIKFICLQLYCNCSPALSGNLSSLWAFQRCSQFRTLWPRLSKGNPCALVETQIKNMGVIHYRSLKIELDCYDASKGNATPNSTKDEAWLSPAWPIWLLTFPVGIMTPQMDAFYSKVRQKHRQKGTVFGEEKSNRDVFVGQICCAIWMSYLCQYHVHAMYDMQWILCMQHLYM